MLDTVCRGFSTFNCNDVGALLAMRRSQLLTPERYRVTVPSDSTSLRAGGSSVAVLERLTSVDRFCPMDARALLLSSAAYAFVGSITSARSKLATASSNRFRDISTRPSPIQELM